MKDVTIYSHPSLADPIARVIPAIYPYPPKLLHWHWHDDVIKWKHFPRYWPFVRGIHRSPVNSPHKGQWRGALMFSVICTWINGWANNREAGDLRRHRVHFDVTLMVATILFPYPSEPPGEYIGKHVTQSGKNRWYNNDKTKRIYNKNACIF